MNKPPPERVSFLALLALLLIAFAFGGGGSREGVANLIVQLAALSALVPHRAALARFWHESPLALLGLIGLSLLLPLLQIIPLPHDVWNALPGRDLVSRSLEAADDSRWMAFSVFPQRTLLALTALVTPLAVLIIGLRLPDHYLAIIGWGVVVLGLATSLLGLFQIGIASDSATLYGARTPGAFLLGTFANRNSTALFLVFALGLAALLPSPRPHPAVLPLRLGLCAVLLITIILTKSRTGFVLAVLPIALAAIKALWWAGRDRSTLPGNTAWGLRLVLGAMALLTIGASALVIAAPGPIGAALERFEAKDDPRRYIWDDASYTASRYWPAGAGMGTFDEVFQVDESLENLSKRTAGRAHNDWLELTIEAGVAGLVLALAWVILIGWLSWQSRQSATRWTAWAGSVFLLSIALQSITDYPLRNQTILGFAGFALLLLVRGAAGRKRARR